MATATGTQGLGGECTIVLMGQMWRCRMLKATASQASAPMEFAGDDGFVNYMPGLQRRRLTVE